MVLDICKGYTATEFFNFIDSNFERYQYLCKLVGEFELGARFVNLGIVLPFQDNMGCVTAVSVPNDIKVVESVRYF